MDNLSGHIWLVVLVFGYGIGGTGKGGDIMENELFTLYEKHELLAIEVGHNSVADWCIYIFDRRGKKEGDWGSPVISVAGCDRKLVFAMAYTELAEYFSDKFGGY